MGHWGALAMVTVKYSGVDFNDWKSDEMPSPPAKEHHVTECHKVPFWLSSLMP